MPRNLPGLCEGDPRNVLDYSARCRLEDAHIEGWRRREEAAKSYRNGDAESESRMYVAAFDCAFIVLARVLAEYRAAGITGARLHDAMESEIESAVYSLELQPEEDRYLRELLMWESGW